ncbi:hypothetical protein HDV00_007309 [Rhizophlyctis rosea]|nr:hypothetical protein HDV00_007309 [Rhizophlyctis rosea]
MTRALPEFDDVRAYVITEVGLIGALLVEKETGQAPWKPTSAVSSQKTRALTALSALGREAFGTSSWNNGKRLVEEVGYDTKAARLWCSTCYDQLEGLLISTLKNAPAGADLAFRRLQTVMMWGYLTGGIGVDTPKRVQMLRHVRTLVEDFVCDEELSVLCDENWDRWEVEVEQITVELRTQSYISCVAAADSTEDLQQTFFLPVGDEEGSRLVATPRRRSRLDRALKERWVEMMDVSTTRLETLEEIYLWEDFQSMLLWFLAKIAIRVNNASVPVLLEAYISLEKAQSLASASGATPFENANDPIPVDEEETQPMSPRMFAKLQQQLGDDPIAPPALPVSPVPRTPQRNGTQTRSLRPNIPQRSIFSPTDANLKGSTVTKRKASKAGETTSASPSPIKKRKFTPLKPIKNKKPAPSWPARKIATEVEDDALEEEELVEVDDPTDGSYGKRYQPRSSKKRRAWTKDELDALEEGMREFGTSWATIEGHFGSRMPGRRQVDMKDKARVERARRRKVGEDEGVFSLVVKGEGDGGE